MCLQETGIILLDEWELLFPKGSQHPLELKSSVPTVFQNCEEREGERETKPRIRRQSQDKGQERGGGRGGERERDTETERERDREEKV